MTRLISIVALLLVAAVSSGCSYNTFVSQEEAIKTQWAQVENQLQRRNDLIPNLVETTKGVAQQERDVFGQIAESRAKLAGAQTPEQTMQAANEQSAALARLLVIVENYPQLRSNETFNRLMDELAGTENRIAVERMRYNERVQEYNTARRQFPSNITASIFGFREYPVFNAPPEAERVPKVDFGRQPGVGAAVMALVDALLPEFDHEMTTTRKVLERVPEDKFDWKPHAKSFSLGALATHLANLPTWGTETLNEVGNRSAGGQQPPRRLAVEDRADGDVRQERRRPRAPR